MKELPKAYEAKEFEASTYRRWEESGYFNPDALPGKRKEHYSIAMPPPNATGILHIGHAVMLALQDILIRFERMRGKRALWVPGTDHAAIATQNVVEKELKDAGQTKHDLGREKFLQQVDEFVATKRGRIKEQVMRLGASCDWSRERFTLDAGLSEAVVEAFKTFYQDGLIYRGTRVVNWCPRCQSTLADDEIEYKEQNTKLYTFRYDANFPIAISTTRPETKFGDTAVAVHPDDERYAKYIGQEFAVSFAGLARTIKVVADRGIDREYGTGALGVTPAHSKTDEAIAQREKLPSIKVIDERGKMTDEAGADYAGLNVKPARAKIVEYLRDAGLLDAEHDLQHNLSICYRCGTPIEPLPSLQWFVAVDKPTKRLGGKSLKQRALEVVEQNEIQFVPDRFSEIYRRWITNLHDWCISRQIWYGHRVPVWHRGEEMSISESKPAGDGWEAETDTLDTWFSSGLWTFSTLGWPKSSDDLKRFHPTDVLETSYDIIFFWVARMILMSTYLVKEVPFKTVYLHGLVRDAKGRKMSKSLGNGIDPLDMADKYGADAVRLSLVISATPGVDRKLDEQKIASYRNYVNKIWNIGRFIAMQSEGKTLGQAKVETLSDRWIMSRLQRLINENTKRLESFQFSQAGEQAYDFAWHELADWYLEITKIEGNVALARDVFKTVLKLLHPYMPFVTEALWDQLGHSETLLMIETWPTHEAKHIDEAAETEFTELQQIIIDLRRQRQEHKTPAGQPMELKRPENISAQLAPIIERLAKVAFTN